MNGIVLIILALLWGGVYIAARHVDSKISRANTSFKPSFIIRHSSFMVELIAVSGLLALATVGFFWQILLTSNTWMPAGGGDLAPFLFPKHRSRRLVRPKNRTGKRLPKPLLAGFLPTHRSVQR